MFTLTKENKGWAAAGLLLILVSGWSAIPVGSDHDENQSDRETPLLQGFRLSNSASELLPPFLMRSREDTLGFGNQVVMEFDVGSRQPLDLQVIFHHCNRDWAVDDNEFLRNEFHNKSGRLDYRSAPLGASRFTYRYVNRFPDLEGIVQFPYSGNHIYEVIDRDSGMKLASGRVIVIDPVVSVAVAVDEEILVDAVAPMDKAHRVRVRVDVPPAEYLDSTFVQPLFEGLVTTVDIYQNHNIWQSHRVSFTERTLWTRTDWPRASVRYFEHRKIYPGNYYRRLDISDERTYPRGHPVRLISGIDLPRTFWLGHEDQRGGSQYVPESGIESGYLDVELRLRVVPPPRREVYVVGSFNQWKPTAPDQLRYDPDEGIYSLSRWLRRGIYDYQYIFGTWDADSMSANAQDWFGLEGNDWRTVRDYYIIVYYDDPRFGGFDRIVGIGKGTSPGGLSNSGE